MLNILRRLGFGVPLRWLLVGLLVLLAGAAFILLPEVRGRAPALQLVAIGAEGEFRQDVLIPAAWADTARQSIGNATRFPLLLALRNSGVRAASPRRLAISLPARYRLTYSDGRELIGRRASGNPLAQYVFRLRPARIEPGRLPVGLPGLDTLWIEPIVPAYDCTVLSDSIPEFIPATQPDLAHLASVRVYYSLSGRGIRERQTGLLTVRLDTAAIGLPPRPQMPSFPVRVDHRGVTFPPVSAIRYAGARQTSCGQPEEPIEMLSTVWQTMEGGRVYVLHVGGAPRKYLLDLDRDSIVEMEMWDPDADGRFEISRGARFPVPASIVPPPPPPAPVVVDTTPRPMPLPQVDVLGVPLQPQTTPAESARREAPPRSDTTRPPPPPDTIRRDTIRRDTTVVRDTAAPPPPPPTDTARVRPRQP